MSGLFDYEKKDPFSSQQNQNHVPGIFTEPKQNSGLSISSAFGTPSPSTNLNINVCRDSMEPKKFDADAITKGSSIFLSPDSQGLLRHEMGHVLQQQKGIVAAREFVAGEPLNSDAALEKSADLLGSQIPQEAVDRAMAGSRTGMPLQGALGVVQCGKTKKKKTSPETQPDALQPMADNLKQGVAAANRNYNHAITPSQKLRQTPGINDIAWPKISETEALSDEAIMSQTVQGTSLIDSLITQIRSGQYKKLSPNLQGHLYRAANINAPDCSLANTGTTGLHAYSDYFDKTQGFMAAGGLPGYIQPLGFIGDRTQIHILHWRHAKTGNEKFSTMLPNNMPEQVSKMLFEVAITQPPMGSSGIREFEGFDFESKGDTFYPAGNNILLDIGAEDLAEKGTGSKAGRPRKNKDGTKGRQHPHSDGKVSLNDISKMLSELSGSKLAERLAFLAGKGIYHPLGF